MYAYTNLETALNAKPGRITAVVPGFCLARAMLAAIATAYYPAYRALAGFVAPVMDSDGPQR